MASIPFKLHATSTFADAYGEFVKKVGEGSAEDRDLLTCLDGLKRDTWNKSPIPVGRRGDRFAVSFHDGWQVTFQRTTDRLPSGKPTCAHLYLMTIERTHP